MLILTRDKTNKYSLCGHNAEVLIVSAGGRSRVRVVGPWVRGTVGQRTVAPRSAETLHTRRLAVMMLIRFQTAQALFGEASLKNESPKTNPT